MNKIVKVFKKIFSVFCVFFFIFSALITIITIANSNSNKPLGIGDYYVFVVGSDSMTGTLEVNDIFLAKKGNDNLYIGQIVTYISKKGIMKGKLITHRIVDIEIEEEEYIYYCRGDKDGASTDTAIKQEDIIATYVTKVPVLSFIYRILTNPFGFVCLIILPILGIFGVEIYKLLKQLNLKNNTKSEEKEKLIKEYKAKLLEELKKDDNNHNNA